MYKLDLLCHRDEIRPILCCVYVTKDWCVATDSMVMGRVRTSLIFRPDFREDIPDEGILIHWEDWKKLKGKHLCFWKADGVICISYLKKANSTLIEYRNPSLYPGTPFPDMDAILSKCEYDARNTISLDPAKLKDLSEALAIQWPVISIQKADLGAEVDHVLLIEHRTISDVLGLLMPVKIEKQ